MRLSSLSHHWSAGPFYPSADDALPFFTDLFAQGLALNMTSFETDFMSDHLLGTPGLVNQSGAMLRYLSGLAEAGRRLNVPMQWCMPTAGLVLASTGLPAVTNGRASVDYACEGALSLNVTWSPNYMIGGPGVLFNAMGLTPSKDIFRSHANEQGGPSACGSNHTTPNFELDAVLAVLSTGTIQTAWCA